MHQGPHTYPPRPPRPCALSLARSGTDRRSEVQDQTRARNFSTGRAHAESRASVRERPRSRDRSAHVGCAMIHTSRTTLNHAHATTTIFPTITGRASLAGSSRVPGNLTNCFDPQVLGSREAVPRNRRAMLRRELSQGVGAIAITGLGGGRDSRSHAGPRRTR